MQEFKLGESGTIDLCDILKVLDWCESGGAAKRIIADGQVLVDGKVETRKRAKLRKDQVVELKGKAVKLL